MSKPLTPKQEITVLNSVLDITIKERDELRALLTRIESEAEALPVPGGHSYTISGRLMRDIGQAVK